MREMGYQSSKKNSQQPKEFRGGEKKVMKKRLALLLSVAMAFSMFANVAFGASSDLTTTQKYDALVKEGIFTGIAGSNDPQLNATTTRAQFAKVLALTLGLEPVNTGSSFKDQNYDKHWAKPYVEALVKENLITGYADGKFHFNDTVTGEQMAKTFGAALGLEEVKDAAAIEGVSKWAYGWVQAVKDAGFDWSENGKWNVPAKRATLVEASYDVREQTSVQVESAKALDEKTVEVKFTDGETEKVTLDKALVEGQETAVKVEHKGKTYEVKVTLQALAITSKVVGASTLEVGLNRTVDTEKAKFTIKRGNTDVSIKQDGIKFSEDKLSVGLTTASKLYEGEYTINMTVGDKTVSTTATVEAEKVVKVELLGDTLSTDPDYTEIKFAYKVVNQYGEDASSMTNFNWNASKGGKAISDENGIVTFKSDDKYYFNEPVVITGQDISNALVATKTYKVGTPAVADSVEFKGVYNADNKTLTSTTDLSKSDFYLLVDIKDQYGNRISDDEKTLETSIVASSLNPLIMNVDPKPVANVGPKGDSLGLKLTKSVSDTFRQSGEVTIRTVALGSGKEFTYKLNVEQGNELKTFKLYTPKEVVAAGDEKVEIPFDAFDTKGEKITSFETLENLRLNSGLVLTGATFEKDYSNGNAKLILNKKGKDLTKGIEAVTATVVKSQSFSTVQVNVRDEAYVKSVKGLKSDYSKTYGKGAVATLKLDNIVLADQYGREIKQDKLDPAIVVGIDNWNNIKRDGGFFIPDNVSKEVEGPFVFDIDQQISLTANNQGDQRIEFALYKKETKDNKISYVKQNGSTGSSVLSVVSSGNISSYEVKAIPTLASAETNLFKKDGATVTQEVYLEVIGKRSNGETVVLNPTDYSVTTDTNKVVAKDVTKDGVLRKQLSAVAGAEGKTTITVLVNGSGLQHDSIPVEVEISKDAQSIKKLVVDGDKTVLEMSETEIENGFGTILNKFKATDQYGITGFLDEINEAVISKANLIVFNVKSAPSTAKVNGNGTYNANVTGLTSGQSFTLTVGAGGQVKSVTIKVTE